MRSQQTIERLIFILLNHNSAVYTRQLGGKKYQASMGMKNSIRLEKIAFKNVWKIRKQTFAFQPKQFKSKIMKRKKQSMLLTIAIL